MDLLSKINNLIDMNNEALDETAMELLEEWAFRPWEGRRRVIRDDKYFTIYSYRGKLVASVALKGYLKNNWMIKELLGNEWYDEEKEWSGVWWLLVFIQRIQTFDEKVSCDRFWKHIQKLETYKKYSEMYEDGKDGIII